jgi:glycosyltransferase involved in cell wall biosynthesis
MSIGYAGYSADWSVPGDRRRFAAYARMKSLGIERADPARPYDLVYATYSSDLPAWIACKKRDGDKLKLVFELIDSYLAQTNPVRRLLKGAARYALGTDSRLSPDLLKTLVDACRAADAVVCSTEEQAATIRRYNPNVVTSFDWFGDDLGAPKTDHRRGEKLRIVWEGQSATLKNLRSVRDALNEVHDKIELHVVTDPKVYRWFGRYGSHDAKDLLEGFQCEVHFHPWDRATFSKHVTKADIAIIPIDSSDEFARGKPENKLVMLWQLGMPALTSSTPSYRRAMEGAGLDLTCTDSEWPEKLRQMISASDAERERLGQQGRAYAERSYSRDEFVNRFDRAMKMAGFEG